MLIIIGNLFHLHFELNNFCTVGANNNDTSGFGKEIIYFGRGFYFLRINECQLTVRYGSYI